jgi:hypothetical protein
MNLEPGTETETYPEDKRKARENTGASKPWTPYAWFGQLVWLRVLASFGSVKDRRRQLYRVYRTPRFRNDRSRQHEAMSELGATPLSDLLDWFLAAGFTQHVSFKKPCCYMLHKPCSKNKWHTIKSDAGRWVTRKTEWIRTDALVGR